MSKDCQADVQAVLVTWNIDARPTMSAPQLHAAPVAPFVAIALKIPIQAKGAVPVSATVADNPTIQHAPKQAIAKPTTLAAYAVSCPIPSSRTTRVRLPLQPT